jgi:mannose/cellobiose epimerase-like protein (N-acyl-D-glucosamine 2-epimerase family)
MWGIENDDRFQKARIWQWYDDDAVREKSLFLELPGTICDCLFDNSFEQTGFLYLCVSSGTPDSHNLSDCSILRYRLQTLPPFAIMPQTPELLLKARGIKSQFSFRYVPNDDAFEISGMETWPEVDGKIFELTEKENRIFAIRAIPNKAVASSDEISRNANEPPTTNPTPTIKQKNEGVIDGYANPEARRDGIDYIGELTEGSRARIKLKADHGEVTATLEDKSDLLLLRSTEKFIGLVSRVTGEPIVYSKDNLWKLRRREMQSGMIPFPKLLSKTGWYTAIDRQQLNRGFVSFVSSFPSLSTEILSKQWIRLPTEQTLSIGPRNQIRYPDGTLFLQTVGTIDPLNSSELKTRETRGLMKTKNGWELFTYRWLDDQSDAELVDISTSSPSESDDGAWNIPSRRDCIACHQRLSSSMTIGFSLETLNERIEGPNGPITHYDLWKESGLISRENQYTIPVRPPNETRSPLARFDYPDKTAELRIDWDWFRESAVRDNLTHWLRAAPTSNGFFQVNLDDSWQPIDPKEGTVVSQARLIYVMAEGYRQTEDPQFLEAAIRGSDFLLSQFRDPKYGGYWWSTNPLGEVLDRTKSSYGQAFAIFALAHAHSVSGSKKYAEAALNAWRELLATMSDAWGGLYENSDESFSNRRGKNQNPIMHTFEAGIALYDATGSSQVLDDLDSIAEFITTKLWREPGCIPEAFDENWSTPVSNSSGMWIVNGHQAEWAFLLSEGVRCGLSRRYLGFGNKLLDFNLQSGYDRDSGGLGEYDAPQKKGAWQQAEFLRAMLRYYSEHGREDLRLPIQLTYQLIKNNFADSKSGGWPIHDTKHKGNVSHCGSHEVLMYSEAIRISQNRNRSTDNRSQPKTRDAPNTTKVTQ